MSSGNALLAWLLQGERYDSLVESYSAAKLPPAHLVLTAGLGLIVFPVLVVLHWTKREPRVQRSISRQTKNIARQLGERPVGQGELGWLAKLPWNQIYEVDLVERELVLPQLPATW